MKKVGKVEKDMSEADSNIPTLSVSSLTPSLLLSPLQYSCHPYY